MGKRLKHFNIGFLVGIVETELALTSENGYRQDCSYKPNMKQKIKLEFDPLTITLYRNLEQFSGTKNQEDSLAKIGYDISTDRIYVINHVMAQDNPFYRAVTNIEEKEPTHGWHEL